MTVTRNKFLKLTGLAGLSAVIPAGSNATEFKKEPLHLNIGLASYTLRNLKVDDVIKICKRLDLTSISLKSNHMPLESSAEDIKTVIGKFKTAGLNIYAVGVIYMKTEQEVLKTFEYAQNAGVEMIIGVPNPELLPFVNDIIKDKNIKLAIHNHGPEDKLYPSVDNVHESIKDLDKKIGFCIDIGHVFRNAQDPAGMLNKYKDRLFDMHMKDITEPVKDGKPIEIGRGGMDIVKVMKTLKKINYSHIVAIEFEKDGDEPLSGLAESVGYLRGLMKTV